MSPTHSSSIPSRQGASRPAAFHRWQARALRIATTLLLALCAVPASALYDAAPDPALAAIQGEWKGTLTYRDYSEPDRRVTLPTRVFVALASPDELVLHYVFDDGPSKTVYSYERMRFDFGKRVVTWTTGAGKSATSKHRIVSDATEDGVRTLVFERRQAKGVDRFTLAIGPRTLQLGKDEIDGRGASTFRDRYAFARP